MKELMSQYTDEDFKKIVEESTTLKEISDKIGYSTIAGDAFHQIKNRIEKLKLSTAHLQQNKKEVQKRNPENIFIENSTAAQTTLRRWYIKGEYSPYVCAICGLKPEWQGKPLTLILDHINGQNKDDRLENLRWVCPNCNQQLDTTGYKKARAELKQGEKIQKYCIDCGCEISDNAVRCKTCNIAYRKTSQSEKIPISKKELKNLIRTIPFTEIARQYNTSKKWILSWCRTYNLPDTKTEIKTYSEEEWEQI